MVPSASRARSLSKQQLEDTSLSPDDRRAFIANLTQQMNKLVRHPAPVSAGVASAIGTRKGLETSTKDGPAPPSQRKGMPAMKVHLGILSNNLTAEDMENLRHCVDHSLVHLDFFAKHDGDPSALREPVFRHIACPETHNIAASVHSQVDTNSARRCRTSRTRGLATGKPKAATKPASDSPAKKGGFADYSSDDEYDQRPRAVRHIRASEAQPGRLELNPMPTEDEQLEEQMREETAGGLHYKASPRACVHCQHVTEGTLAAEQLVGLVPIKKIPGKPDTGKKKKHTQRFIKGLPHLVATPDASATRVLPAIMRLRALETIVSRLSPMSQAMLHGVVQRRDSWQTDDASAMPGGVAIPRSCDSIAKCCALHVDNLFAVVADTSDARDGDDALYDSTVTEEQRNEARRRTHTREQRQNYSAAAVVANLSVERWMKIVNDCHFDEHAPSFSLPLRSRYASLATIGNAWEELYAAVDVGSGQVVPHMATLLLASALSRDSDDTDQAAEELALWCILTVLRIEGATSPDGVARSFASVNVSLCEAFAIRDLIASTTGSTDGRVVALSSDIDKAVEGGTNVPVPQLISSLRSHFVRC